MSDLLLGSVDIHTGELSIRLELTAETVAALEETVHHAITNGRMVLVRFIYEGSTNVVSTVITGSTQIRFGYRKRTLDPVQTQKQTLAMIKSVDEASVLNIGVPAE
ncbi:hypothetical protein [Brevibacterium aurantiacum]|uniref:hypothetical protein n=1 Tax=Brevibacterium aurantiacum TaxID=273384 RepID=UPI003F8EBC00